MKVVADAGMSRSLLTNSVLRWASGRTAADAVVPYAMFCTKASIFAFRCRTSTLAVVVWINIKHQDVSPQHQLEGVHVVSQALQELFRTL